MSFFSFILRSQTSSHHTLINFCVLAFAMPLEAETLFTLHTNSYSTEIYLLMEEKYRSHPSKGRSSQSKEGIFLKTDVFCAFLFPLDLDCITPSSRRRQDRRKEKEEEKHSEGRISGGREKVK